MVFLRRLALLGVGLSVARGAVASDLEGPVERPTTHDAYTEAPGTARIDLALGGTFGSEIGVMAGLRVGLPEGFELSTNLAHYGFGMFNVRLEWNAVDLPHFGLGLGVGAGLMRPQWMWYLEVVDPEIPVILAKMTLLTIPWSVTATFPVGRSLFLSAGVGYDHTEIYGTIDATLLWFEGSLGARGLWAAPSAHVMLGRAAFIEVTANIPIVAWVATAFESSTTVEDGVVVGVRSAEWQARNPIRGASGQLVAEIRAGKTHFRLGVGTAALYRAADIPVVPFLGVYWRII